MMPLIAVAALFGAIVTFTDMTVVYVLTRGGPTNSTQVPASWAFFRGIEGGDIAQGAAVALFLFPLLLTAADPHSSGGASHGGVVTWWPSRQSIPMGVDTAASVDTLDAGQSSVTDWLVWGCTRSHCCRTGLCRPVPVVVDHCVQTEPGPLSARQQPVPVQPAVDPHARAVPFKTQRSSRSSGTRCGWACSWLRSHWCSVSPPRTHLPDLTGRAPWLSQSSSCTSCRPRCCSCRCRVWWLPLASRTTPGHLSSSIPRSPSRYRCGSGRLPQGHSEGHRRAGHGGRI